ncbi:hypothetical protein HKX48_000240 [Thoreauomyces humboldtii]|nr:hypothetical protein HKX48_000240 [Thoreauomyces humboldtii]
MSEEPPVHDDRFRPLTKTERELVEAKPLLSKKHNATYTIVNSVVTLSMEVFYKETRVEGLLNLPKDRGCILAANHWNMATDIGALMQTCPRKVHFWTKAELFNGPSLIKAFMNGMGCLPVKRNSRSGKKESNDDLFQHTVNTLIKGGVIAIFPEGTSHHTPHVTDLKDGASFAALQNAATVENPDDIAPIVPVGITYEPRRWRWRNHCVVRYGEALEMTPYLAEFAEDPRGAAKKLTAAIQSSLEKLTINAPDWPTLESAYRIQSVALGPSQCVSDLSVIQTILRLKAEKNVAFAETSKSVDRYYIELGRIGLLDKDLEFGLRDPPPSTRTILVHLAIYSFVFSLTLIVWLPCVLLHLPAFLLLVFLRWQEPYLESKAQKQIFSSYLLLPLTWILNAYLSHRLLSDHAWFDAKRFLICMVMAVASLPTAEDWRRGTWNLVAAVYRLLSARRRHGDAALKHVDEIRKVVRDKLRVDLEAHGAVWPTVEVRESEHEREDRLDRELDEERKKADREFETAKERVIVDAVRKAVVADAAVVGDPSLDSDAAAGVRKRTTA